MTAISCTFFEQMALNSSATITWTTGNQTSSEKYAGTTLPADIVKRGGNGNISFSSEAKGNVLDSFQVGYFAGQYEIIGEKKFLK